MIAEKDFTESFPSDVHGFFGPDGPLSKDKKYEYRPQQQQMAVQIARALQASESLVIEAGTGVGKSLAYLVPSIQFALHNRRKAVVSTHTINLQEQLMQKDIPLLRKVLPPFEAALFKGRQNYLCQRRLARAVTGAESLFETPERTQLEQIREWAATTEDGTLSDLPFQADPKVWSQVCSERGICNPRTCSAENCFYQRARLRMQSAHVIVINHHLLFLNLGQADDNEGFLFGNDFLVFDEAHTIESVAARCLGASVSTTSFRYVLHQLYNPKSQKGGLVMARDSAGVKKVTKLLEAGERFFEQAEQACNFTKGAEFRVRRKGLVPDTLSQPLADLLAHLRSVTESLEDHQTADELRVAAERVTEIRDALHLFLNQAEEDHVYWVERSLKGPRFLELNASPVDLAELLHTKVFSNEAPVIMTSATLAVNGSLDYFVNRVGALEADKTVLDSPFDYRRQMRLFIPKQMPDPNQDHEYVPALCAWIRHFVAMTHGKAFVLFTSYRVMQQCAQDLAAWFDAKDIRLFVQGEGLQRHKMLEAFRQDVDSVLFGTDSFWTGVDVAGEALSDVIITRLPFAVPDHPLVQSRLELIEKRGSSSFAGYSLPEAVLKLRQGVGRLIRSKNDTGIVAILDNRLLTKSYGRAFLDSLPDCPVEILAKP